MLDVTSDRQTVTDPTHEEQKWRMANERHEVRKGTETSLEEVTTVQPISSA